jgi:hypothetical protein
MSGLESTKFEQTISEQAIRQATKAFDAEKVEFSKKTSHAEAVLALVQHLISSVKEKKIDVLAFVAQRWLDEKILIDALQVWERLYGSRLVPFYPNEYQIYFKSFTSNDLEEWKEEAQDNTHLILKEDATSDKEIIDYLFKRVKPHFIDRGTWRVGEVMLVDPYNPSQTQRYVLDSRLLNPKLIPGSVFR